MTEPDAGKDVIQDQTAAEAEPELYVEPAQMTRRDLVGVILALVLLAVIGVAGYIWLNPNLSWQSLTHRAQPTASAAPRTRERIAARAVQKGVAETKSQDAETSAVAGDATCPQCGMFAQRSASYIIARWDGGKTTQHDSWDCVFKYSTAQGSKLASTQVKQYGVEPSNMLEASAAWYLYETKHNVENSMPPGVAAYADQAAARAAQPEMGGEVVDFAGLKAKWE
jgi:hypothetical protein